MLFWDVHSCLIVASCLVGVKANVVIVLHGVKIRMLNQRITLKQSEFRTSSHPLFGYLPDYSIYYVDSLVKKFNVHFKVVAPRSTKLGDCRFPRKKKEKIIITLNQDLNPFQFLVTSLHELAHALTFIEFKHKVRPHGKEWKLNFSNILMDLINQQVIPDKEREILLSIAKSPKSTSFGNVELQQFVKEGNTIFLRDIADGSIFNFKNRDFRKIKLLRSYVLCSCTSSHRQYKIHGLAEISPVASEE